MTVQHILVPTDFSEYADYALDFAISLAQKLGARLTLLHVVEAAPLEVAESATPPPSSYWQQDAELEQKFAASLQQIHDAGLQGEDVSVQGAPSEAIIHAASGQGADLIVMGTHGRTGLSHMLMGSVAEKVVRMAPCPVLVTRGTTAPPTTEAP